jgi:hypothetical protein
MTSIDSTTGSDHLAEGVQAYRRLAAIDPPAMRSLAAELERLADESSVSAVQQGTAEAAVKASRDADRAAAAHAALASPEPER